MPRVSLAVLAAFLAAGIAPARLRAQPAPDTSRALPGVEAALRAVADSLCAWAAAAAARGDTARVEFEPVLRPALIARAVARCPARGGPVVLQPGQGYSTWRLTAFQFEGTHAAIEYEWEGGVPNAPGMSWFTNGFRGEARPDGAGRWDFVRSGMLRFAKDGAMIITSDSTLGRRP